MIIYGRYSSQTNDDGQFKIEKYFLFKLSFVEKINKGQMVLFTKDTHFNLNF